MDKCKQCGTKIIKFPLWKGQEFGEPFAWNKLILKNLFKMDMLSFSFLIIILFSAWAYTTETAACEVMLEQPCTYCNNTGCCDLLKISQYEVTDKIETLDPFSIEVPGVE